MICECSRCNHKWSEYSTVSKPCPNCGGTKIYFTHLGYSRESHQVLIDIETNKMLSDDPCAHMELDENGRTVYSWEKNNV